MSDIDDNELLAFARAFGQLASEAYKLVNNSTEIADLFREHLGIDPTELPVVIDNLDTVERPNLQLALDQMVSGHQGSSLLTTNRLEILEPALAARPGRVDHAIEIDRPDADGREQLLRLYLGDAAEGVGELRPIVERTAGVTASFFKELVRRATFLAIEDDDVALGGSHLVSALDELLEHAAPVMRTMLGVDRTANGGAGPPPPPGGFTHAPLPH